MKLCQEEKIMQGKERQSKRLSEKYRLPSDPPPKSPILRDFEGGLVWKSPKMGGWGASVRIFDTSQTSSKGTVAIIISNDRLQLRFNLFKGRFPAPWGVSI